MCVTSTGTVKAVNAGTKRPMHRACKPKKAATCTLAVTHTILSQACVDILASLQAHLLHGGIHLYISLCDVQPCMLQQLSAPSCSNTREFLPLLEALCTSADLCVSACLTLVPTYPPCTRLHNTTATAPVGFHGLQIVTSCSCCALLLSCVQHGAAVVSWALLCCAVHGDQ